MGNPKILVLMGSNSDLQFMGEGLRFLEEMEIDYTVDVSSAHRDPDRTVRYARQARDKGYEVIIAIAGMAAHLPGVIASHTTLPVIGVPASGGILGGVDALLSIVQMPKGIPVATVGLNAGKNAAILACMMLSIKYESLREKLEQLKKNIRNENRAKAAKMRKEISKK